ncbi:hypothetical protein OAN38_00345 [Candidatus Marinimicrobia bacterium]|nr:hypothetical protein [Candidatus Neomarinimicrobiota bacterium]
MSSSLTRVTRREIPSLSQEKPHFIVGFFVSILFIYMHSLPKVGHKKWDTLSPPMGVWDFRLQR